MKDKKILLYAGTTEGRKLASYLGRRGVRLHVCVATAYGESLLPEEKNITVTHDRMDSGQMGEFMRVFEPDYVIDATHPYAKEVTKNLKSACEVMQVPYLRLVRGSEETKESICVENMDEAIKYLEKTEGNILVTTGSKELESYTRLTDYESRVYARVLSIGQVAVNCEELGFSGRHLICMQGPFSTEMNRAMLKEYDIAYMVTKESGLAGGYPQKCQAALEAGVKMVVIGRPEEEEGMNFEEMSKFLQKELELDNHWKVTLVGIGAGARDQVTLEAKRCCQEAELLIGAGRMIEAVAEVGQTIYEAYRPDEIISYIKENPEYENVTTKMTEYGMGEVTVRIGTELSYKNEEIQTGTARSLLHYKGENLAVLYIENESGGESPVIPAIPDDTFVRGDVPMTKEEVRSISIAKLKIKKDAVVYDVGAGTGSISVEAAMVATQGNVYAIEQKVEAQELIRENARRMHVDNLHVIEGMAPEALEELPAPDCVFIGGSKGKLYEILDAIRKKNPFVRVVLNAISLETMMQVLKYTEENEIEEAEVIQVAVSRAKKVGSYHMMNGQNPIYVISFTSRPAKKEADPENEDDFVLEEINLDEVEPEDMTGDIVEDITKVISVGDLTPEKIREEMEESE